MAWTLTVQNTFVTAVCQSDLQLRQRSTSDFGCAYRMDDLEAASTADKDSDVASLSTDCGGQFDHASESSSEAPVRRRRRQSTKTLLGANLASLERQDPSCILILKKINRLGFAAAEVLARHYSRYGAVAEVLLSNAQERSGERSRQQRLRPSGMGWLRFESASSAALALSAGEEQWVEGAGILVRQFVSREDITTP